MTSIARSTICGLVGARNLATGRGRAAWRFKEAGVPQKRHRPGALRFQSSVSSGVSSSSPSTAPSSTVPPSQRSRQESSSRSTPPPPPRSRPYVRALIFLFATTVSFAAGFTMAAAPILSTAVDTARAALDPPTDEETLSLFVPDSDHVAEIERQMHDHPLTKQLLSDPRYIASRPHLKIPEALRSQNLTGGTLLGADKIAVPPLQFHTEDGTSFVSLQWLGPALCGHPGIVHGGLIATLLDEGTARCCFPALPNKVAVTASLKIDYKNPTFASQIVVLKAETTKVEGRKAWVTGRLETLADEASGEVPKVLAEAEALFIEPRGAANMKKIAAQ